MSLPATPRLASVVSTATASACIVVAVFGVGVGHVEFEREKEGNFTAASQEHDGMESLFGP